MLRTVAAQPPIRAVLVCGGRWHDFDHARLQLLQLLGADERVRTRVFEDYHCLPALADATVLVTYTCDVRPDTEQQAALVEFVARGGRWLALHGTNAAIDPPGADRRFSTPRVLGPVAELLGSQFLGHPPIAPYTVEVSDSHHPLVEGIEAFEVTDELYVSELHPPHHVLLHTRFAGECTGFTEGHGDPERPEIQPVLYLRPHGAGAVCYFTLGHCRGRWDLQDLRVPDLGRVDRGSWVVPQFREVLERCVRWGLDG
jgi:type 1 glutamine amidotransferase